MLLFFHDLWKHCYYVRKACLARALHVLIRTVLLFKLTDDADNIWAHLPLIILLVYDLIEGPSPVLLSALYTVCEMVWVHFQT